MNKFRQLLKQYWGYDDFRGIQAKIIESISAGHDTLGLMPTGGGKSVTFQVPALAKDGTCIVVTPLIALMKDQVQHLRQKGIRAAAVYSGMSRQEIIKALENCIYGGIKLLYVSPERLSSPLFIAKLKRINVSFITVDEAHCISQWGYDFRPAYLKIADIRKLKPEVPVLALTATATPQVIDDIQEKLGFCEKNVFRMSFARENLSYVVRQAEDKFQQLVHILSCVDGSAIVYVRSRRRCKDISEMLEQSGLSSTFYHAGLEPSLRDERQKAWQANAKRVMVATNAFGMGIDKPDVRLVVHVDCPDSIEAYFQEAGRAGRDGKRSYAVLLWNGNDEAKLRKRIGDNFPSREFIANVYNHLAYFFSIGTGSGGGHTFGFDIGRFCFTYHFFPIQVNSALHLLESAGYLHYETDPDSSARLMILLGRNELYRLESLTTKEETVMTALLRLYGGLFTDYEYIDESLVAAMSGMDNHETYQILKSLNARHIISFIPQRKSPYITYIRDREDEIFISRSIYEERKVQYAGRIEAVIAYATNCNVCRSRLLLGYFGEEETSECGCCDVCKDGHSAEHYGRDYVAKLILSMLADKAKHRLAELNGLKVPTKSVDDALEFLVNEGIVGVDVDKVFIRNR